MVSYGKEGKLKKESKRKETKRKHILSVSIEVSDIESSHGVASAEHGCFDEDPYRATGDLKVRTQCFNRLNGANVAYSSEYDKRFNRKIKEWQKLDTQISDLDMIFFLKQEMGFKDSKKNNHEHKSVYKEFEANGKKITLRVSDHHYINSQHSGKRHLTSLTFTNPLRESFDWNEFQPKEDNAVEYSYNVEDFTNREMIEILKAIQEFLRDGIYNCTIIPDKVNKSERHKQNELQKAEKKQKKGMGVTNKNKRNEQNNSKPTPDDVKLVKTKLALKVKAAKILELIS